MGCFEKKGADQNGQIVSFTTSVVYVYSIFVFFSKEILEVLARILLELFNNSEELIDQGYPSGFVPNVHQLSFLAT